MDITTKPMAPIMPISVARSTLSSPNNNYLIVNNTNLWCTLLLYFIL